MLRNGQLRLSTARGWLLVLIPVRYAARVSEMFLTIGQKVNPRRKYRGCAGTSQVSFRVRDFLHSLSGRFGCVGVVDSGNPRHVPALPSEPPSRGPSLSPRAARRSSGAVSAEFRGTFVDRRPFDPVLLWAPDGWPADAIVGRTGVRFDLSARCGFLARIEHWAVRCGTGMLALETVVKIRIDHFRDKVPINALARKRGVAQNTMREAVRELSISHC